MKLADALLGLFGLFCLLIGAGWIVGLLLGWKVGAAATLIIFGALAMTVAADSRRKKP